MRAKDQSTTSIPGPSVGEAEREMAFSGGEGGKTGEREEERMIWREGRREGGTDGGKAEWMILREGGREGRMDEKGGKDDLERGELGTWGRRKGRRRSSPCGLGDAALKARADERTKQVSEVRT